MQEVNTAGIGTAGTVARARDRNGGVAWREAEGVKGAPELSTCSSMDTENGCATQGRLDKGVLLSRTDASGATGVGTGDTGDWETGRVRMVDTIAGGTVANLDNPALAASVGG